MDPFKQKDQRAERHWQAFLAVLTGVSIPDNIRTPERVTWALNMADEAVRQYRGPEEQGNG